MKYTLLILLLFFSTNCFSQIKIDDVGDGWKIKVDSAISLIKLVDPDKYEQLKSVCKHVSYWNGNFSTNYSGWPYPQNPVKTQNIKGKIAWTQTRVLGTSNFIYSVSYYDLKDRVIQTQIKNLAGGLDVVSTQYTWAGQPFTVVQRQQKPGTNATENIQITRYLYDDLNRVASVRKTVTAVVNGISQTIPEIEIVKNEYDRLGQLKNKKLGKKKDASGNYSSEALESMEYDYNIRGWLLGANRDYARDANSNNYFGFDLGYDKIGRAHV